MKDYEVTTLEFVDGQTSENLSVAGEPLWGVFQPHVFLTERGPHLGTRWRYWRRQVGGRFVKIAGN